MYAVERYNYLTKTKTIVFVCDSLNEAFRFWEFNQKSNPFYTFTIVEKRD